MDGARVWTIVVALIVMLLAIPTAAMAEDTELSTTGDTGDTG